MNSPIQISSTSSNYTYRIYPDANQQTQLLDWLEMCTGVYNYTWRELKDWIASRQCSVDGCSFLLYFPNSKPPNEN